MSESHGPAKIMTIRIVRDETGAFYARQDEGLGWGITHSESSVSDLLRNTAEAIEKIHELSPGQLAHCFIPDEGI